MVYIDFFKLESVVGKLEKHYESNNVVALALQEAVNKCLNNPLDGDKTVKQTTGDVLAWNSLKELGVLKEDE